MPEQIGWVTLFHPVDQVSHRVPDNAAVVADFQARGWETPDQTAARVEAEAGDLRGKALDQALDDAGLSKSGTVAEKQARLTEHAAAAQAAGADPTDPSAPTIDATEGEQPNG